MILEEETYKKFGYYPRDLTPKSNKKIVVACDDCDKIREIEKSHYHPYCSSCVQKGERGSNWKGGLVKRICEVCGNEFFVIPYIIKKGWGKYCSHKCMGIAQSKKSAGKNGTNWQGGPIECECQECGAIFYVDLSYKKAGNGKFCSCKCAGIARAKKYICEKSPNWQGGPIERKCKICGRPFFVPAHRIKKGLGKYCSRSCAAKANINSRKFTRHPTKPEVVFEDICKRNNLPFSYVGNKQLWIGKKGQKLLNPDFVETNGKKILIEVFGDYWHSPLLNYKLREIARLEYRKKHFKRYKWQPIFIWERDLLRSDADAFVLATLKKERVI